MQGVVHKRKCGYEWMRVGQADAWFKLEATLVLLAMLIYLALWVYRELPDTRWQLPYFVGLYLGGALVYINLGVWVHEQLHCLPFRGTIHEGRKRIFYIRKYWLVLSGYYRVTGPLSYRILRRALLGPLWLTACLLALGLVGSLVLAGWWLPLMLTFAVVSVADMLHDVYWVVQTGRIGEHGKYWDNGRELEVVWKEPLARPTGA